MTNPQDGEYYLVDRGWACHTKRALPEIMQIVKKIGYRDAYLVKLLHYPAYKSTSSDSPRSGYAVLNSRTESYWVRVDSIASLIKGLREAVQNV